jgi:hypothetical protein
MDDGRFERQDIAREQGDLSCREAELDEFLRFQGQRTALGQ